MMSTPRLRSVEAHVATSLGATRNASWTDSTPIGGAGSSNNPPRSVSASRWEPTQNSTQCRRQLSVQGKPERGAVEFAHGAHLAGKDHGVVEATNRELRSIDQKNPRRNAAAASEMAAILLVA